MRKMMRVFLGFAAVVVLSAISGRAASADTISGSVTLINPGFESPGTSKISGGWDMPGYDIPGWSNGTVSGVTYSKGYTDTGVENGHHSGSWCGYLHAADVDGGSLCQLTTHQIAAGETFTLTFYAHYSYGSGNFFSELYYIDNTGTRASLGSLTTTLGSNTSSATSDWAQYTVTASVNDDAVGSYIGIYFSNRGKDWCEIDDVALTYTSTVPEPSAAVLIGTSLVAVLAYSWRKRRKCELDGRRHNEAMTEEQVRSTGYGGTSTK